MDGPSHNQKTMREMVVSAPMIRQLPVNFRTSSRDGVRTQFAALCWRIRRDRVQILLVTSRGSGRWIIPKGWPEDGMTPAEAALREAWEEGGVIGRIQDQCLGVYSYEKAIEDAPSLPCLAMVYPVRVKSLASSFPERNERRRKWFSPRKAAQKVAEPELARILHDFDPRLLRG